ncbi:hypothetical protein [Sediminicurvatus halobius]|uniref:Uncharacterized protein n=1 Tax=Sediminicurvatus halobius TaxID=2182432 RepID=A0A2U2MY65_9GAMM|nr:hypothetical protein [Spiribacter halobius]PWG61669.1 hypothetical protein DEM34_15455 [Spiribacter halobius]UEX79432.1 hypothetical protein LMH63_07260 [Spiribacter halobius]
MTMQLNADQPEPASGYYLGTERADRAVEYTLSAAHGWEFLLDNHLEAEEEQRQAVRHSVVLGEN